MSNGKINVTPRMLDAATAYLECFVKDEYGFDVDRMLNRASLHTSLIQVCLDDNEVIYTESDIRELKRSVQNVTDNLDKSIGMPIDFKFEPCQYAEKLACVLAEKLIKSIQEQYTEAFREGVYNLIHSAINAEFWRYTRGREAFINRMSSNQVSTDLAEYLVRISCSIPRRNNVYGYTEPKCLKIMWESQVAEILHALGDSEKSAEDKVEVVANAHDAYLDTITKIARGRMTISALHTYAEE